MIPPGLAALAAAAASLLMATGVVPASAGPSARAAVALRGPSLSRSPSPPVAAAGAPVHEGSAADGASGSAAALGAPRFLDVGGLKREMQRARGQVLFVHLWASWCGPCLEELPLLDRFARAARARGAVVLSISLDSEPRRIARVPTLLQARAPGLTPMVARFDNPDQFMSLFSTEWEGSIPALFVFDRSGKLHRNLIGEVEPADLAALLAEMIPPPPAERKASSPRGSERAR